MSESLYVAEFLFFDTFLMHFLFQTVLFSLIEMIEMSEFHPKIMSLFLILLISELGSIQQYELLFY